MAITEDLQVLVPTRTSLKNLVKATPIIITRSSFANWVIFNLPQYSSAIILPKLPRIFS